MTFDIPPGATALSEDGISVVFADGEENVTVAGYNAMTFVIEFRLYGETFYIKAEDLSPFVAGGVNG